MLPGLLQLFDALGIINPKEVKMDSLAALMLSII